MNAHLVTIYDKPPTSRTRLAWWRFVERQLPMLVIYLLVATLVGVILAPFMLVTVPSGYVGVLWKRFGGGTVLNPKLLKDEGMRITLPWNRPDGRMLSSSGGCERQGCNVCAGVQKGPRSSIVPGPRPKLHLPFAHWPPTDRRLWHDTAKTDDPFSDAAGTHLAKTTLHRLWMGWRRFLGFLAITEATALEIAPAKRLTIERVRRFADHLAETNS